MSRGFTNILSYLFGELAKKELPLQKHINTLYVKLFGLDMREFADSASYRTLSELFCRTLSEKRFLEDGFISPSDGFISKIGDTSEDKAIQAKGLCYSLKELVGEDIRDKLYITTYLSPKDYHRYHAPCDMKVLKTTYMGGSLFPVNKLFVNNYKNLFLRNERAVLKCEDSRGEIFYLVFVGALNVGSMSFNHIEKRTNEKNRAKKEVFENIAIYEKGDELGSFRLGSTIIFVGSKKRFKPLVNEQSSIRFGQKFLELI